MSSQSQICSRSGTCLLTHQKAGTGWQQGQWPLGLHFKFQFSVSVDCTVRPCFKNKNIKYRDWTNKNRLAVETRAMYQPLFSDRPPNSSSLWQWPLTFLSDRSQFHLHPPASESLKSAGPRIHVQANETVIIWRVGSRTFGSLLKLDSLTSSIILQPPLPVFYIFWYFKIPVLWFKKPQV